MKDMSYQERSRRSREEGGDLKENIDPWMILLLGPFSNYFILIFEKEKFWIFWCVSKLWNMKKRIVWKNIIPFWKHYLTSYWLIGTKKLSDITLCELWTSTLILCSNCFVWGLISTLEPFQVNTDLIPNHIKTGFTIIFDIHLFLWQFFYKGYLVYPEI